MLSLQMTHPKENIMQDNSQQLPPEISNNFNELYNTYTLIGVVENLYEANTFFVDNFFSSTVFSNDAYVAIDIDVGLRRMSPFVSPLHEGKLVESRKIRTRSFAPPYIKDKRAPDLLRPVRRALGERIGGNQLTAVQRMDANIGIELADQKDNLKRRLEWMATQSIVNGYLRIKGDGYEESIIDFLRDPSLNIVLSGKSMWDDENTIANPSDDIRNWATNILKLSGSQITDLIFTNSAYSELIKNKDIYQAIFNSSLRANNDANLLMGPNTGSVPFQGYWGGYRIWLYNEWYIDEDIQQKPMIEDGNIIGISKAISGTLAYAAIKDGALGYIPAAFAPSMWIQPDPSQIFMMLQSSPLTILGRPNACFTARVAKGKTNG